MAEKKENKVERIYTVNLSKAYDYVRTKRAGRAVKILRDYLARHFKVAGADVSLSEGVNSRVWRDSIQKPPRKLKVRAVKEEGVVKVFEKLARFLDRNVQVLCQCGGTPTVNNCESACLGFGTQELARLLVPLLPLLRPQKRGVLCMNIPSSRSGLHQQRVLRNRCQHQHLRLNHVCYHKDIALGRNVPGARVEIPKLLIQPFGVGNGLKRRPALIFRPTCKAPTGSRWLLGLARF